MAGDGSAGFGWLIGSTDAVVFCGLVYYISLTLGCRLSVAQLLQEICCLNAIAWLQWEIGL
jgi:hypothetical protein